MSTRSRRDDGGHAAELAPDLAAVRDAAQRLLDAQIAGDGEAEGRARMTEAAKAALDAGHAVSEVAGAELAGQRLAREGARGQLLREVQRTAKRVRDATRDHEHAVVRAARAGLSAREIAQRGEIAHATVGAIVRRHDNEQASNERVEPGQVGPVTSAPPDAPTEVSG